MNNTSCTPDEIMVSCMARQVVDEEMVVQGIATPLVAAAYLLAKKTHAPNLYFASAIGQGVCRQPAKLTINQIENLWLDRSLMNLNFVRVATEVLPCLRPKEFFRPAQIDMFGNFNNLAFGRNYAQPRLRLPGTGGIPDVTTYMEHVYLYIPRHSKVTFVSKLDFQSGMGYNPARTLGHGPRYLISNLGQFDFSDGRLRITSYHPNVDVDRIKAKTGFELKIAPNLQETPPPSMEELKLLREEIDPMGIRRLELLSGPSRRKLLHEILSRERGVSVG